MPSAFTRGRAGRARRAPHPRAAGHRRRGDGGAGARLASAAGAAAIRPGTGPRSPARASSSRVCRDTVSARSSFAARPGFDEDLLGPCATWRRGLPLSPAGRAGCRRTRAPGPRAGGSLVGCRALLRVPSEVPHDQPPCRVLLPGVWRPSRQADKVAAISVAGGSSEDLARCLSKRAPAPERCVRLNHWPEPSCVKLVERPCPGGAASSHGPCRSRTTPRCLLCQHVGHARRVLEPM